MKKTETKTENIPSFLAGFFMSLPRVSGHLEGRDPKAT